MMGLIEQLTHLVLSVLGVLAVQNVAALGVTVAVIAVAALLLSVAVGVPFVATSQTPHPLRAIDVSAPLAQSDPDAGGHPRPRAPGVVPAV